jgi:hypothetical protein
MVGKHAMNDARAVRFVLPMLFAAAAALSATASAAEPRELRSDTWVATDGLGRALPGAEQCPPPRRDRFVGIFYFLWMEPKPGLRVFDISKILAANPLEPQWGTVNAFHWWGEPQFGYYTSNDAWVIRRHAQMLSAAGVDMIAIDVTNALTYDGSLTTLLETYQQIRAEGGRTPDVAFLCNSAHDRVARHLHERFYAPGKYDDLWFRWKGKPLLMANPEGIDPDFTAAFTLRRSWAWTRGAKWFGDGKDRWPWIDHTPQGFGWHDNPKKPEQMAVAVGQHATLNVGRSFHDGKQPPREQWKTDRGLAFDEQWQRALTIDPEFVFITGWNEWIAQRFIANDPPQAAWCGDRKLAPGDTFFVDQFTPEYSRDIEPMRGGFGDAYYYQMVAGIRKFKGVRRPAPPSPRKTIAINGDFSQWADVQPEFLDTLHDTTPRNHPGYGDTGTYANETGRNDFDVIKVARDAESFAFYVRTRDTVTAPDENNWMMLLIDADGNAKTGWNGYDVAVNRRRSAEGRATVEKIAGDGDAWEWKPIGEAELARRGNELHVAVPRPLLGVANGRVALDFKWIDNTALTGDVADFIDKGDAAPDGRFNFRFRE